MAKAYIIVVPIPSVPIPVPFNNNKERESMAPLSGDSYVVNTISLDEFFGQLDGEIAQYGVPVQGYCDQKIGKGA